METLASATTTCPRCGATIAVDSGFVAWCENCNWNVDPSPPKPLSAKEPKRADRARARGVVLFEELKASGVTKPLPTAERTWSFVIALAIHAVTFVTLGCGVLVLVRNYNNVFGYVIGLPLLLAAILVRPRVLTIKAGTVILPQSAAPTLYGLVNRVAASIDAKPVDIIALDARFNASHGHVGLRRRRALWLGLALWRVLNDEERVALLGHELGHQVNGDLAHGMVVGTALNSLREWYLILRAPRQRRGGGSLFDAVAQAGAFLSRGLMALLRAGVRYLYRLELTLLFASNTRAEYFADALAARVGSSGSAAAGLDILHVADNCTEAVRLAASRGDEDIWGFEKRFFDSVPPKEWERLRRLHALRGTSIDASHPPTDLRVALVGASPVQPGVVTMTPDESKAIAAELDSGYSLVASQLTQDIEETE